MTVAVVMGSDSDLPTMRPAVDMLGRLEIPVEVGVVSAHRTPHDMLDFGRSARERGIDVIIAGAGGAAHLPGMLASVTTLPVIGVPVAGGTVGGIDALFSIAQMPRGVPVATMAIGGAENAALLAARILGVSEPEIADRLDAHAEAQVERAREGDAVVRAET